MKTATSWLLAGLGGGALIGALVMGFTAPSAGREVRSRRRKLLRRSPTPEEIDAAYAEAEQSARAALRWRH